jgi:hypothetical protein
MLPNMFQHRSIWRSNKVKRDWRYKGQISFFVYTDNLMFCYSAQMVRLAVNADQITYIHHVLV